MNARNQAAMEAIYRKHAFGEVLNIVAETVCIRCGFAIPCGCAPLTEGRAAAAPDPDRPYWDATRTPETGMAVGWTCTKCGAVWPDCTVRGCGRCNGADSLVSPLVEPGDVLTDDEKAGLK